MDAAITMVGLSGGVDSSVAALLLRRAGEPVGGLFMKNWEEDDRGACTAERDAADAEGVARALGIAFHSRNFAAEYWDGVFEHFLAEHRAGRTPNPDVLCNREIKFRTFIDHALDLGAARIATGHYARVGWRAGRAVLLRAADLDKDQSYFLHAVGHRALAQAAFPVGHLRKAQVRALAAEAGLATHAKKDSTGICFIGERDFRAFLARFIAPRPGPVLATDGSLLGAHQGLHFHTLGQRGGLGIGGVRGRPEAPWYVVGKDLALQALVVDQDHDSPCLLARRLRAEQPHWVAGAPPATRFAADAKVRYRQPDQRCEVAVADDGTLDVRFDAPQRAVAAGQSVVFYHGEACLGGATIAATDAAWGGLNASPALPRHGRSEVA